MKTILDLVSAFDELVNESKNEQIVEEGETQKSNKDCLKEDSQEVNLSSEPKPKIVSVPITCVDEDTFKLPKLVKEYCTSENVMLKFTHDDGETVVPGIIEEQLLCVLLYRYRNNPDKYNLIKQLLQD